MPSPSVRMFHDVSSEESISKARDEQRRRSRRRRRRGRVIEALAGQTCVLPAGVRRSLAVLADLFGCAALREVQVFLLQRGKSAVKVVNAFSSALSLWTAGAFPGLENEKESSASRLVLQPRQILSCT